MMLGLKAPVPSAAGCAQLPIDLSAPLAWTSRSFWMSSCVLAAVRDERIRRTRRGGHRPGRSDRASVAHGQRTGDGEGGGLVLIVPPFGCPTARCIKAFDAWLNLAPGAGLQAERVRGLAAACRAATPKAAGRQRVVQRFSAACTGESRLGEVLQRREAARIRGGKPSYRESTSRGRGEHNVLRDGSGAGVCDCSGRAPELVCVPTRMLPARWRTREGRTILGDA